MPDNLTYKKLNSPTSGNNKVFYTTFIEAGYTPIQAAGMIGNLMYESGGYDDINPSAGEKGGVGFGAAQWTDSKRKKGLQTFSNSLGLSVKDPKAQALYIVHELNSSHSKVGEKLRGAKDLKSSMEIFLKEYENPKAQHQQPGSTSYDKRLTFANNLLGGNSSANVEKPKFWYEDVQFGKNDSGLKDNAFKVMSLLKTKFPSLRVTSGLRKASQGVGKNAKVSRHNIGEAFDIGKEHKDVFEYLNSHEGVTLLDKYGLGVLDETDPVIMKKTGATGAHFHIGADTKLVAATKNKLLSFNSSVTGNPNTDDSHDHNHDHSENVAEGFKASEGGLSNSYILESLDSLNKQLENKNEQASIELRNKEIKNNLLQRQQEKDFLVAQVLSINLPFVERGY